MNADFPDVVYGTVMSLRVPVFLGPDVRTLLVRSARALFALIANPNIKVPATILENCRMFATRSIRLLGFLFTLSNSSTQLHFANQQNF